MNTDEAMILAYLLWCGFSHSKLRTLLDQKISLNTCLSDPSEVANHLGISDKTRRKIQENRSQSSIEKFNRYIVSKHITLITIEDNAYPKLLQQLTRKPVILHTLGNPPKHDKLISVVGSRKHSSYAKDALQSILPGLLHQGYEVVSGGAYGLDGVAHNICVQSISPTHVVFGSGIDIWHPASNKKLFQNILDTGGSLVSPFPIGMKAEPYHFPIRNNIVAGLSRGTLVAEAGRKSGTLITAKLALEFGRDVFVIPSTILSHHNQGGNELLRDGYAKLVTCAEDILIEYGHTGSEEVREIVFENDQQEMIYLSIQKGIGDIDSLLGEVRLGNDQLTQQLSIMEIQGIIKRNMNGKYQILT